MQKSPGVSLLSQTIYSSWVWVHSLLSMIRDKPCDFLTVIFWQIHQQHQYHKAVAINLSECVFLHVYRGTCVGMGVRAYVCVCISMWRPVVGVGNHP